MESAKVDGQILKVDGVGGPCQEHLWLVGTSEVVGVGIIQELEVCLGFGSNDIQDQG